MENPSFRRGHAVVAALNGDPLRPYEVEREHILPPQLRSGRPSGGGGGACARTDSISSDDDLPSAETGCDTLPFTWSQHSQTCMRSLHEMFLTGNLCDVTLRAGDEMITCHRVVISSLSVYFNSMFSIDMQEMSMHTIELKDICGESLRALVEFAYTGMIQITRDNVEQLLQASAFLQVQSVLEACGKFLVGHLDSTNCVSFICLGEAHGCEVLLNAAVDFCLEHFSEVVCSDDFPALSATALERVMSSDLLNVPKETSVYKAMIIWANAQTAAGRISKDVDAVLAVDRNSTAAAKALVTTCKKYSDEELWHVEHLPKLMAAIRWPFIKPPFLLDVVKQEPMITKNPACMALLEKAKDFYLLHACNRPPNSRQPVPNEQQQPLCRLRSSYVGLIYAVGGRGGKTEMSTLVPWSNMECYSYRTNTWSQVCGMKRQRRHVAACSVDGRLYVVGGHDGKNHLRSLECYDPGVDMWVTLDSMSVPRRGHALVSAGEHGPLYAIGGINESGSLSTVERYNVRRNLWTTVMPIHQGRGGCGGAALGQFVYVAGGNTASHSSLQTVEAYDILSDVWFLRRPMIYPRAGFGMVSVSGKIIAVGGFDDSVPLSSVEVFNPRLNKWTEAVSMTVPRGGVSVTTIAGIIFAVGGYDGESYLNSVEALGNMPRQEMDKKAEEEEESNKWKSPLTFSYSGRDDGKDIVRDTLSPCDETMETLLEKGPWKAVAPMHFLRAGAGVAGVSHY